MEERTGGEEPRPRTFAEGSERRGERRAAAAVCSGELVRLRGEGAIILAAARQTRGSEGEAGRGRVAVLHWLIS